MSKIYTSRDDGEFVYAVQCTGIYCRPSCPALSITPGAAAVIEVCQALQQGVARAERPPAAAALAASAGVSVSRLHKLFKAALGVSINQYSQALRSQHQQVRDAVAAGASITAAIVAAGYSSTGHFYQKATSELGMPVRRYQNQGQAMNIEYAITESTLGKLLVARSEAGICAIALGDNPEALAIELQRRFANAQRVTPSGEFGLQLQQIVGFIEQPGTALPGLSLDIRGTAFQRRVWQALQGIKPGQTINYRELAERIGAPTAARAVANACGANTLAVLVPCHRVVRSDGGLSGYRWGVGRKRELLRREAHSRTDGPNPSGRR